MKEHYSYAFLVYLKWDAEFFGEVALYLEKRYGRKSLMICYGREPEIRCEAMGLDYYSMQKECAKFPEDRIEAEIPRIEERYRLPSLRYLGHHQLNAHVQRSEKAFILRTASYFLALENLFGKVKIDHLVQEIAGWTGSRAAEFVSQEYGTNHVYTEPCMFKGHCLMFANAFYPIYKKYYRYDEMSEQEIAFCEDFINKAVSNSSVVKPVRDVWQYRDMPLWWAFSPTNLKKVINAIHRKYVVNKGFELAETVAGLAMRHFKRPFRRLALKPYYVGMGEGDRFYYYPLHMPIDLQILVREPQFYNQYALIEYIARMIPQGTYLYVKEHPVSIGTYDFFQMRKLTKIPNIKVIDPTVNSHAIIRKAEAVITVNSKVGFESLYHGKPVITLGDSFYRRQGLTLDLDNIKDLAQAIRDARTHKVDRQKLVAFLHSLRMTVQKGEMYLYTQENYREFAESVAATTQTGEPVAMASSQAALP